MTVDDDDEAFITTLDLVEDYLTLRKSMDDGFRDFYLALAQAKNSSSSARLSLAALSALPPPEKNTKQNENDDLIRNLASKYGCAEEATGTPTQGGPPLGSTYRSRHLQPCRERLAEVLERARQVAGVVSRLQVLLVSNCRS